MISQISSDSISGGGHGSGDWQLFGDGVDLTLSVSSGETFVLPRIIVARWDLRIDNPVHDVSRMADVFVRVAPGQTSAVLHLDIIPSGPITFSTDGELWIPDRQIKQLSIAELFGLINNKIDER